MKKHIGVFLGIILLIGVILPHAFAQAEEGSYVEGTDLKKAIEEADDGAILKLKKGTSYNSENDVITINKNITIIGDEADNNSKAIILASIVIEAPETITVNLKNYRTSPSGSSIKGDNYKFIDVKSQANLNLDGVYIWNIYRSSSDDKSAIALNLGNGSDNSEVNINNSTLSCFYDGIHVLSNSTTINIQDDSSIEGKLAINYENGNSNKLNITNSTVEGMSTYFTDKEVIAINNQTNFRVKITDSTLEAKKAKEEEPGNLPTHLISINDDKSSDVQLDITGKTSLIDNNYMQGGNLFNFGPTTEPKNNNIIKLGKDVTLSSDEVDHKYNDSNDYAVVGIYDKDGASTIKAYKKNTSIPADDFPTETINGYRFDGWFQDKDKTVKFEKTSTIDKNLDIYPKFTKIVNVEINGKKYQLDEGKTLENLDGVGQSALNELKTPDGNYSFDHFEDENGNKIEMSTSIDKDITLKAIFKVSVTIDETYDLEKGKTLKDLMDSNEEAKQALEELKNKDKDNKDFASFVSGSEDILENTPINENTTIKARYTINIKVGDDKKEYPVDENSTIASLDGDVKDALNALKTASDKTFLQYVDEDGNKIEESTKLTKHTTIKAKYTIELTIGGNKYTVDEGTKLSELKDDALEALNALNVKTKKLTGYVDEKGNDIDANAGLTKNTTVNGKYNVVITIDGEEYEIKENQTLNDLDKEGANALKALEEVKNKTFKYYVDGEGKQIEKNSPISKNTTIKGKYTVNVTINGKAYEVDEETKLSQLQGDALEAYNALASVEGKTFKKRVDSEGHDLDLEQELHQHIEIVGKYEINITINGEEYSIEDGQTLNDLKEDGAKALKDLEDVTTKKFDHFEDTTGKTIEKTDKLNKHTEIIAKYLIEVTISGKKYYVNENDNLSKLNSEGKKALEALKNVDENIKKFDKLVDEKGNTVEETDGLNHNLEVKGLYKVTITIGNKSFDIYENETLENLSTEGSQALEALKTPADGNGTWKRWQDKDGNTITSDTQIKKHTTIVPVYTIKVTIDEEYELEKGKTLNDLIKSNDSAKQALKALEKTDKILVGYEDEDKNAIKDNTKITKDVTIKGVYEVEITIGNEKFRLDEGQNINDLSKEGKNALDSLKNTTNKTFIKYVDGNGNEIDFTKDIHSNMVIKGVYKITVTIGDKTYTLAEGQTLNDLDEEAKQKLTELQNIKDKDFSRFVASGKTVDMNTKLYQNTKIIPKYNIKVTIGVENFTLEEGMTLKDLSASDKEKLNELKKQGINQKFVGFRNVKTNKIISEDEEITEDIILEPVFEKINSNVTTDNSKENKTKNPTTLDRIGNYFMVGIISLLSIIGINFKKIKNLVK